MPNDPYKMTPETVENYCAAISIGATLEMAAAYADVHPTTPRQWLKWADEAQEKETRGERLTAIDRRTVAFKDAVLRAKAEAGMKWQQVVNAAAEEDPAWAWRMLQIRFPEEYREPPRATELTGPNGTPLALTPTVLIYIPDNGRDPIDPALQGTPPNAGDSPAA